MKKFLFYFLMVGVLLTTIPVLARANDQNIPSTAVFVVGSASYTINNQSYLMDAIPFIKDGRVFVPIRFLALACSVSPENIFFENEKITLIKGEKVVQLILESNDLWVNGVCIKMDTEPILVDGRAYLPARWVSQALGYQVEWDEITQTVIVSNSTTNEQIQYLRGLKINAPPDRLTLGGRIHNLRIEIQIHKLGKEPKEEFQTQVEALMFPRDAILTLYGKQFQEIAINVLTGLITDDEALQQLQSLYNNWQLSIQNSQSPSRVTPLPSPSLPTGNLELVYVYKVLDLNNKAIIVRRNGEMYLIEYGIGVLSLPFYEGKNVYIYSPGVFAGVGSKIIIPDRKQEARIWDSQLINE